MARVLMLKNRKNELRAMSKILEENLFPDSLIPLIEIIREEKEYDKKIDPATGEFVTERRKLRNGAARKYKVDDLSTERDVTLQNISELFKNRIVLVEYFRCNLNLYKGYDPEGNTLIIELNLNLNKYREKSVQIAQYDNLIPVIAIKNKIDKLKPDDLIALVEQIRTLNPLKPIAIRIDEIDGYERSLQQVLTSKDYLLFDISEQSIRSKEVEYEELANLKIAAKPILICSPRKRDVEIKDYEHRSYTGLIDNSGISAFGDYGFVGYGDYGGLSDKLPTKGFANRDYPGRALALIYSGQKRAFKSYVCDDVTLGQAGYRQLMDPILQDRDELDPSKNCIVYRELDSKIKRKANCTYQDWKQYTLMRYVQEIPTE